MSARTPGPVAVSVTAAAATDAVAATDAIALTEDAAAVTDAVAATDAIALMSAAIDTQQQILAKLRLVAAGLQQDLAMEDPDQRGCAVNGATLAEALATCRDRIALEEAVLEKLRRLRQGLALHGKWGQADERERGNGNGKSPGAL